MVASTRFRRLFASGGGYTLFMPALIKVYAESEQHEGIRRAIEFAANRFYAHHRESFVFQSLDVMSHVIMLPEVDGDWVGEQVYNLFSTLKSHLDPNLLDMAGIRDANKLQEYEALMITTAEETPQTFLASLRNNGPKGAAANAPTQPTLDLPQEYVSHKLSLDDFVRMFLTVIAHDFNIARAEHFMRFLRYITPSLYNSSTSARGVLHDGIDALGVALSKMLVKNRGTDWEKDSAHFAPVPVLIEEQLADSSKKPSNAVTMQLDYLMIVAAFTRSGGALSGHTSRRVIDLVKSMLRETSRDITAEISSFIVDFTKHSLMQEKFQTVKAVNHFLLDIVPIVSAYALSIDFSGFFEAVKALCSKPFYANDPSFGHMVISQICAAGLASCELAASDNLLFSLPCRTALVSLLAEAVFLRGADVISEIEKRAPTYDFLAGVILPLAMVMKTRAQLDFEGQRTEPWHRSSQAHAWARLLAYTMSAGRHVHHAQLKRSDSKSDRRRSSSSVAAESSSQISTFITAIQVVKIITIRAEKDLSACIPDIWSRLGSFLLTMLSDGNAEFAVRAQDYSPLPSPSASPRASLDPSSPWDMRSPSLATRGLVSPRIVDYSLWSLFELLCLYRTPLLLQLRVLIQENLYHLDTELQHQFHRSPRDSRRVSAFTKPRRVSSIFSSSPEHSPNMKASNSLSPYEINAPSPIYHHSAYHQIVPPPPGNSPQRDPQKKIVHLGLISNPTFPIHRSSSPASSSGMRLMTRSTKVKSLSLIRATYKRIRTVQTCMGYHSTLLPLPHGSESVDEEDVAVTVWSSQKALRVVLDETRQLLEEFEESPQDGDRGSGVMVDEQTFTP